MSQKKEENKKLMVVEDSMHWYPSLKKKNIYYPSITTLLSVFPKGVGFNMYLTAQTSWESSQQALNEAAQRGTRVHEACDRLENGEELIMEDFHQEEWLRIWGFKKFVTEYKPKLIYKELGMVSDKFKTGGRIDRVYEIGGKIILLDIKTGKSNYDNYYAQTSAYAVLIGDPKTMFYEKAKHTAIDDTAILRLSHLSKNNYNYSIRDKEEWKNDFKSFQHCQGLWNYLNPDKKSPKILEVPATLKLL